MKRITETEELAALRLLDGVVGAWDVLSVSDHVAEIARGAFPNEPVRTLDALHLASARVLSDAMGPLHMLSLDDRLRRNAAELGMELRP
jgi:predicted nucleic acid-binding protein